MSVATLISPEARDLLWTMADRADKSTLHLPLSETLVISIERKKRGQSPQAEQETTELVRSGWIGYADDGGWELFPAATSHCHH